MMTSDSPIQGKNSGNSYDTSSGYSLFGKSTERATVSAESHYPVISLVTPCFNQRDLLQHCIESVLEQDYPNLQYVIMDGGSTDGSVELIKSYEDKLHYWTSGPDGGPYQAIQTGFSFCSGTIMGWINADDKLHKNGLFNIARTFTENPHIHFASGRAVSFNERGDLFPGRHLTPQWSREALLDPINFEYPIQCIMQEATFWTRQLWEQAGAQLDCSLELAADYELWARFMRYAPLYTVDALFGGFRDHSDTQRSKSKWDDYVKEATSVIAREKALPIENKTFFNKYQPIIQLESSESLNTTQSHMYQNPSYILQPTPELPKLQLVLICDGHKEDAVQCIDSALSCNSSNIELAVIEYIDDPAKPPALTQFDRFISHIPTTDESKIFELANLAFNSSSAEIMGLSAARVHYNDLVLPAVGGIFSTYQQFDWIAGRSHGRNRAGVQTWSGSRVELYAQKYLLKGNFHEPFYHTENIFWRRTLWKRAGACLNKSTQYAADVDLWLRFHRLAQLHSINFMFAGKIGRFQGLWERDFTSYCQEAKRLIQQENTSAQAYPFVESEPPAPLG